MSVKTLIGKLNIQRGEIATILTIISAFMMLAGILIGSVAIGEKTQLQSKAENLIKCHKCESDGSCTPKSIPQSSEYTFCDSFGLSNGDCTPGICESTPNPNTPSCPNIKWTCIMNGVTDCADQVAIDSFTSVWCEPDLRWKWEDAGETDQCGGSPSKLIPANGICTDATPTSVPSGNCPSGQWTCKVGTYTRCSDDTAKFEFTANWCDPELRWKYETAKLLGGNGSECDGKISKPQPNCSDITATPNPSGFCPWPQWNCTFDGKTYCSDDSDRTLFLDTWCNGQERWLWEKAGNTNKCGGKEDIPLNSPNCPRNPQANTTPTTAPASLFCGDSDNSCRKEECKYYQGLINDTTGNDSCKTKDKETPYCCKLAPNPCGYSLTKIESSGGPGITDDSNCKMIIDRKGITGDIFISCFDISGGTAKDCGYKGNVNGTDYYFKCDNSKPTSLKGAKIGACQSIDPDPYIYSKVPEGPTVPPNDPKGKVTNVCTGGRTDCLRWGQDSKGHTSGGGPYCCDLCGPTQYNELSLGNCYQPKTEGQNISCGQKSTTYNSDMGIGFPLKCQQDTSDKDSSDKPIWKWINVNPKGECVDVCPAPVSGTPYPTPPQTTRAPTPSIIPGGPSLTPKPTITLGGPTLTPITTPTIRRSTPSPTSSPGSFKNLVIRYHVGGICKLGWFFCEDNYSNKNWKDGNMFAEAWLKVEGSSAPVSYFTLEREHTLWGWNPGNVFFEFVKNKVPFEIGKTYIGEASYKYKHDDVLCIAYQKMTKRISGIDDQFIFQRDIEAENDCTNPSDKPSILKGSSNQAFIAVIDKYSKGEIGAKEVSAFINQLTRSPFQPVFCACPDGDCSQCVGPEYPSTSNEL